MKFFYWLENYKSELLCPLYQVFFVIFYARDSRRYSNNYIIAFFLLRRIKKINLLRKKRRLKKRRRSLDIRRIVCYDQPTNSVFYSTCTRGGAKQSLRTTVETNLLENTSAMEWQQQNVDPVKFPAEFRKVLQLWTSQWFNGQNVNMECQLLYRRTTKSETINKYSKVQVVATQ